MSDAVSGTVLRDILAGCEGVTAGPWDYATFANDIGVIAVSEELPFCRLMTTVENYDRAVTDSRHIARLDPQTIASIVSELIARREADVWQDISTAPPACHVMAARWDECEWVYGVVMSPPGKPWTHWRPLPQPPLSTNEPKP